MVTYFYKTSICALDQKLNLPITRKVKTDINITYNNKKK